MIKWLKTNREASFPLTGAVHLLCFVPALPDPVDCYYHRGSHVCCSLEHGRLQNSDCPHLSLPITWSPAPFHIFASQRPDEACVCWLQRKREFWNCREFAEDLRG